MEIGISEREFWSLNPHRLLIRVNVYNELEKRKDEEMWRQGAYFYRAILSAIDMAFGGELEYFEKPMYEMAEDEKKELTEEEKAQQVKAFFLGLQVMQSNFEREHKKDVGGV